MSEGLIIFLAGQLVFFVLAAANIYSNQQSKNREFEMEIQMIKTRESELSKKFDNLGHDILRKMDLTQKDIVEIKLSLERHKANNGQPNKT